MEEGLSLYSFEVQMESWQQTRKKRQESEEGEDANPNKVLRRRFNWEKLAGTPQDIDATELLQSRIGMTFCELIPTYDKAEGGIIAEGGEISNLGEEPQAEATDGESVEGVGSGTEGETGNETDANEDETVEDGENDIDVKPPEFKWSPTKSVDEMVGLLNSNIDALQPYLDRQDEARIILVERGIVMKWKPVVEPALAVMAISDEEVVGRSPQVASILEAIIRGRNLFAEWSH